MNLLVTMLPTCKVYLNEDDDDDDVDIEEQAHSAHYPPLEPAVLYTAYHPRVDELVHEAST